MSKHWVREELHKDRLASAVDGFAAWVRRNREYLGGAAITLAVVGVLGAYFASRAEKIKDEAWNKYFEAQQLAYMNETAKALDLAGQVQANYPKTEAAANAALFKGDLLFETEKYKEAAQAYAQLAGNAKHLAPFAELGEIMARNADGDYAASIDAAKKFVSMRPDSPLAPQAYLTMARSYQAMGNAASAKETLAKVASLFPETVWGELVKDRKPLTQKKQI